MVNKEITKTALAAGALALVADKAVAKLDTAALDRVLEPLKTYDWGADRETLNPIDQAINATHGDAAARRMLEKGLVDALAGGLSRSAHGHGPVRRGARRASTGCGDIAHRTLRSGTHSG